jgi:hypothetical protein
LPLLIHEQVNPYGDAQYPLVVNEEVDFLFSLLNTLVTLQIGPEGFQVFVEDVDQIPWQLTSDKRSYASTVVVHLKQPSSS